MPCLNTDNKHDSKSLYLIRKAPNNHKNINIKTGRFYCTQTNLTNVNKSTSRPSESHNLLREILSDPPKAIYC